MEELRRLVLVTMEDPFDRTAVSMLLGMAAMAAIHAGWWLTKASARGTWKALCWCFASNLNELDRLVLKEVEGGVWSDPWAGTGSARVGLDKTHGTLRVYVGDCDVTRLLSDAGMEKIRWAYSCKKATGQAEQLAAERAAVLKKVGRC